ncbi:hypothetical protein ACG7TL_000544 [Trametes sanguinea]
MLSTTSSLKERLLSAEDDFLSALADGSDALFAFTNRWERLVQDVDAAIQANCLDTDVSALAHVTSMRIATLADASDELYATYESCTTQLIDQIQVVMSDLTLLDHPAPPQPPSTTLAIPIPCPTSATRKRRRSSSPEYENLDKHSKRSRVSTDYNLPRDECQTIVANHNVQRPLASAPFAAPSRKRRFSDSEPTDSMRPQKRRYAGPRLHAVSDSYVASHSAKPRIQTAAARFSPIAAHMNESTAKLSLETRSERPPSPSSPDSTHLPTSKDATELNVRNGLSGQDDVSVSLPGLDGLDAFLESIFQVQDPIITPASRLGPTTPRSPSHLLYGSPTSEVIVQPSQSSPSSSDSDTGSSPASSMPSSPRSAPTTPSLDAEILKFDLGASQCFPADDWSLGDEFQLDSFIDVIPPLPEVKWPGSPMDSCWIDVSGLISPSLDEDFESLLSA